MLSFLETMTNQSCNLACHGCTNYSDLRHSGYVTWAQGKEQISNWLHRIDIPDFGIMGGEPLMNPDIEKWIIGIRELLPNAQIRFTTNGLLLSKKFHVIKLLEEIGNCVFKITVHVDNDILNENIQRVYHAYEWQDITEFGIQRHTTGNDFRFHVKRPTQFFKTYQGTYDSMMPHNSDPVQAFDLCIQQTCPLLYNGMIYKCSTAGLLKDTLQKVGNPNSGHWQPYMIDGLSPDCDDAELWSFINNFGKPHAMCRQCPTKNNSDSIVNHLENVAVK